MIVEKIYHIGDIHIRNLKRHKEYREVFKRFFENIKRDNIENSIICIIGDIAHAKTEMSPELVREISWFLTECAKLRETFLIAGNHDCNLNNNFRLDALTPIIDNLANPKIHYLRDTEVYTFGNLTFAVYSIFDNKENWPKGTDIVGENKICLFHGPVNDAKTDIGYVVSSKSFTTELFKGFDIALLADIHLRQTMGGNHIAYCGSMIQQNHSETLKGHGYLLWDVKSRTFEGFDLHNDYGFYTLNVIDGKIPDVTDMPKKPRLRVHISNTEPSQIKRILTNIKKKYDVEEFTVTRMDTLDRTKSGKYDDKLSIGNIKDVEFQNELIKDYLERHYFVDAEIIDKIKQINRDTNIKLVDDEIISNIVWTPKTFEFSNMFSYGEDNIIRFDNANGIVGVFAPNRTGKSSVFDALSFCIFDKASRTFLAKKILNNQKTHFECKFHFQIDSVDYFIERTARVVNKGKNVKVDVNFWKEENGVVESLNGTERRDTNAVIQKYLGKYDDFVLTTLSLQGNNALFIDKLQTERKEILARFMGVDIFDKLYQHALDDNRETITLIKKFKKDDFTTQLASIETVLSEKTKEYKLVERDITKSKKLIESYNQKLISLNERLVKLKSDKYSLIELEASKTTTETKIQDLINQRDTTQSKLIESEERQILLEELLDTFDVEDILDGYKILQEQNVLLKNIDIELDKLRIRETSLVERLEHLKLHKYNPDCEICMENSKSILEAKQSVEAEMEIVCSNILEQELNRTNINEYILSISKYEESYNQYITTKQEFDAIGKDIDKFIGRLSTYENQEILLDNELKQTEQLIADYLEHEKQIKKNNELRERIQLVRNDLGVETAALDKYSKKLLSLNGEVSSLKNQKQTIEKQIEEVRSLEEQHTLYEYYLNALGKDGISYELISKALPMIEGEINNILGQIVEFGIQLEMDGKTIDANIVYDTHKWSLEMCSGMERFITGLAIRIALINVCNLPRPNFLVVDEGFGSLDNENLTSLYMLFAYLKTQFDFVMLISHIDSMRDVVDNLMEIKKVDGFSYVKF